MIATNPFTPIIVGVLVALFFFLVYLYASERTRQDPMPGACKRSDVETHGKEIATSAGAPGTGARRSKTSGSKDRVALGGGI